MYEGLPVFISAGTKKPKEARALAGEKIAAWLDSKAKIKSVSRPLTVGSWAESVKKFLLIQHAHSQPATRAGVAGILRDFAAAAEWTELNQANKEAFRTAWALVEVGRASKTKANWLGVLGSFARWLEAEEILDKDFTRGVKRPPKSSFGRRETIYQERAFQPIWEELPLWARPLWEDHWFTGMDTKDLWEFKPRKDLVNVGENWKIWKKRSKEHEIIDQPLNSNIRDRWVKLWASSGPETFMYDDLHKRFSDEKSLGNMLRKSVYAAQARRGLPKLDIKSTRHTFTTRHVLRLVNGEKNAPSLDQVRRWLGHAPDSRVLELLYLKLRSLPHLMD